MALRGGDLKRHPCGIHDLDDEPGCCNAVHTLILLPRHHMGCRSVRTSIIERLPGEPRAAAFQAGAPPSTDHSGVI